MIDSPTNQPVEQKYMTSEEVKQAEREAGKEGAEKARQSIFDACDRAGASEDELIANMVRLSRYRGKKPFVVSQGKGEPSAIEYSEPLDDPGVQRAATRDLMQIRDMFPSERHEVRHTFDARQIPPEVQEAADRAKAEVLAGLEAEARQGVGGASGGESI